MLAYQETPDPAHLDVMDGFRAVLIFLVGWYHIWQQSWISPSFRLLGREISLDFLLRSGYIWVDGLLLLSGFLLYLPYAQAAKAPAIRPFYRRRLIRIVPSYLLCVLPLFVLAMIRREYPSLQDAGKDLLAHLTFTHPLFECSTARTHLNGTLWTVGVEMQFYLLFPFLARAYRRRPLLTWCLMTGAAWGFRGWASAQADTTLLFNQLPAFLDVYANGFAAAAIFTVLRKKLGSGKWDAKIRLFFTALFFFCCAALISMARNQAAVNGYAQIRREQMALRFPFSAALACAMLCAAFGLPALRFALGNPLMRFFSAVSFQFYIYHQLIAVQLKAWRFPPSALAAPWAAPDYAWQVSYTLCCFLVSLTFAALITFLFERPLARRLNRPRPRRAS